MPAAATHGKVDWAGIVRIRILAGTTQRHGSFNFLYVCREVMWEENEDGRPVVSGVRLTTAGRERIAKADAYVAALDVPGAKRLIPEVVTHSPPPPPPPLFLMLLCFSFVHRFFP